MRAVRGRLSRLAAGVGVAVLAGLATGASVQAAVLLPPPGKAYSGLTGSNSVDLFASQVGKAPAVFGFFVVWGDSSEFAYRSANAANARLMLHISTAQNYGQPQRITPLGIARGNGDGYLVSLNRRIAEHGKPTYVRLMAEMNQTNNGYSAFDRNGRPRGASHATSAFRQAWRRATLILRGGPIAVINAKLTQLRLPRVRGVRSSDTLPRPQLAMAWVPQTRGSPDIPANMPRNYWPGPQYVDWIGTDFYSKFPRFDWLTQFYDAFRGKPFMFGEWALWGGDSAAFVRQLFSWMRQRPSVRMALYNQGASPTGPFRLNRFPAARSALRSELRSSRWLGAPRARQPPG